MYKKTCFFLQKIGLIQSRLRIGRNRVVLRHRIKDEQRYSPSASKANGTKTAIVRIQAGAKKMPSDASHDINTPPKHNNSCQKTDCASEMVSLEAAQAVSTPAEKLNVPQNG